jgi:hypothetical protein
VLGQGVACKEIKMEESLGLLEILSVKFCSLQVRWWIIPKDSNNSKEQESKKVKK